MQASITSSASSLRAPQSSKDFKAPARPGDTITGAIEVLEVRTDKPTTKLAVRVIRDDGAVALEGSAARFSAPSRP